MIVNLEYMCYFNLIREAAERIANICFNAIV